LNRPEAPSSISSGRPRIRSQPEHEEDGRAPWAVKSRRRDI
jgi:hypothetical protein